MRTTIILVFVLISCSPGAIAQVSNHAFLQKLKGEWSADGKAFGMPAKITMSWQPSLAEKFMQLKYKMEMKGADGRDEARQDNLRVPRRQQDRDRRQYPQERWNMERVQ